MPDLKGRTIKPLQILNHYFSRNIFSPADSVLCFYSLSQEVYGQQVAIAEMEHL